MKIPNRDPNDKTPWESFAVPANFVHENKFSNGLWMKLPADGTTKVSRSMPHGKDDMGRTIWQNESRTVSNTQLKAMVEAYKERPRVKAGLQRPALLPNPAAITLVNP